MGAGAGNRPGYPSPFLAAFDAEHDSPSRNYAIPDDDARPTPEEVEDLRRAFARRNRLPRLEFLPAAAPAAEAVLLQAGFVTEDRLAIMTCAPAQLRELSPPPGIRLTVAVGNDALRQTAAIQNTPTARQRPLQPMSCASSTRSTRVASSPSRRR